ncbi:Transcriptional regulator OS=Streptomyces fumanus OX=67302 GN=GCM10018772_42610 PE=4 SV=1 [Streptomyces fumanus]
MTHINVLDPGASPLDYYGFELRRYREAAGLTQKQLGEIVNYTGSLIGQIETARKLPTSEFSERVDAALGTGGALSRLVALVMRSRLPAWFQQMAELEARAVEICAFQTHMVHGLLQTPAYVRAVLGAFDRTDLDDRTAVRLARQRLFSSRRPTHPSFLVGDQRGGPAPGDRRPENHAWPTGPSAVLQAEPSDQRAGAAVLRRAHPGSPVPSSLFRFASDPAILYTERYGAAIRPPTRTGQGLFTPLR